MGKNPELSSFTKLAFTKIAFAKPKSRVKIDKKGTELINSIVVLSLGFISEVEI
jgi:hypothetical protein